VFVHAGVDSPLRRALTLDRKSCQLLFPLIGVPDGTIAQRATRDRQFAETIVELAIGTLRPQVRAVPTSDGELNLGRACAPGNGTK
jgi:hypothetical protein